MTRRLDPVQRAIAWQAAYASLSRAAAPRERVRARLAGVIANEEEIAAALGAPALRAVVEFDAARGLIALREDGAVVDAYDATRARTRAFLQGHARALALACGLPRTKLVALSGGCAHDNAVDGDIDLFVVAEAHRAWSTLLGFVMRAKAAGLRRVLCLNFVVDEDHQALPWRDFYAGFEVVSLRPLDLPEAARFSFLPFLEANAWVREMFPNFVPSRGGVQNAGQPTRRSHGPSAVERASRMIYRPYLRRRLAPSPGVELSDGRIRLHSTDHRERLRAAFSDLLTRLDVEAPAWI